MTTDFPVHVAERNGGERGTVSFRLGNQLSALPNAVVDQSLLVIKFASFHGGGAGFAFCSALVR